MEIGYCGVCGGEIYAGDRVFTEGGEIFHEDCLVPWAEENLRFFERADEMIKRYGAEY